MRNTTKAYIFIISPPMHFSLPILVLAFMAMLSSDDSEAIDSSRCQIAHLTILVAAWKG